MATMTAEQIEASKTYFWATCRLLTIVKLRKSRFCRIDTKICMGGTHVSPLCRTFAAKL